MVVSKDGSVLTPPQTFLSSQMCIINNNKALVIAHNAILVEEQEA